MVKYHQISFEIADECIRTTVPSPQMRLAKHTVRSYSPRKLPEVPCPHRYLLLLEVPCQGVLCQEARRQRLQPRPEVRARPQSQWVMLSFLLQLWLWFWYERRREKMLMVE